LFDRLSFAVAGGLVAVSGAPLPLPTLTFGTFCVRSAGATVQVAKEGICSLSHSGHVTSMNLSARIMFGFAKEGEKRGEEVPPPPSLQFQGRCARDRRRPDFLQHGQYPPHLLCFHVLHCTLLYWTALHCTVLYCTVSTVLSCAALTALYAGTWRPPLCSHHLHACRQGAAVVHHDLGVADPASQPLLSLSFFFCLFLPLPLGVPLAGLEHHSGHVHTGKGLGADGTQFPWRFPSRVAPTTPCSSWP